MPETARNLLKHLMKGASIEDWCNYIEMDNKNFWTLQNNWMYNVEQKYSQEAALQLDGLCYGRAIEVAAYRLKRLFTFGNDDLDIIAKLDFMCDDIGLDTMSTGVAVAVAMDAGYKKFGDGRAAIEMVEEVASGTDFGKIIGNGPAAVGKHFNHERVPVIKGQSIAAYDPRALQGMAVTYATTPMGGDHTAGWVVDQNLADFGGTLDPLSAEGQVEASRDTQLHMAAVDTVGICDFAQTGLAAPGGMENVYTMISAKSGKPFGEDDWGALGRRVLKAELNFNKRAGFTAKDDRLPKMFYEEPLSPHNSVVVITDEQMDSTFNF